MLMQHFTRGLLPGADLCLNLAAGGSFSHLIASEGKQLLNKILEKASDNGEIEEPLPHPHNPPEPSTQEEEQTTHQTPTPPSTLKIDEILEPSTPQETERVSLPVENPPSVSPFSFEDELFMDFGNSSQLPKVNRRFLKASQPPYILPIDTLQTKEDLLWLSAVINRE